MSKRKLANNDNNNAEFVVGFSSSQAAMPSSSDISRPKKLLRRSSTFGGGSVGTAKLKRRGSVSETPKALQPTTAESQSTPGARPPGLSFQSSAEQVAWEQQQDVQSVIPQQQQQQLLQRAALLQQKQQQKEAVTEQQQHEQQQQQPSKSSKSSQSSPPVHSPPSSQANELSESLLASSPRPLSPFEQEIESLYEFQSPPEFPDFRVPARYRPIQIIGSGSYGQVMWCHDKLMNEPVAVKLIKDVFCNTGDARRILREIKILRNLRHDHIVPVKNFFIFFLIFTCTRYRPF